MGALLGRAAPQQLEDRDNKDSEPLRTRGKLLRLLAEIIELDQEKVSPTMILKYIDT